MPAAASDTLARIENVRVRAIPPAYLSGVGSTSQLSARPPRGVLGARAAVQAAERRHRAARSVPAAHHQPDLFAADTHRCQKLSPLIDRINDRFGRCAIGFGLLPPEVRAFKGHAALQRVPASWEF
jgi:hypothetical protein